MATNSNISNQGTLLSYALLTSVSIYCSVVLLSYGMIRYSLVTFLIYSFYAWTACWTFAEDASEYQRKIPYYNFIATAVGTIGLPFLVADLWIAYGYLDALAHFLCGSCIFMTPLLSSMNKNRLSVENQITYPSYLASLVLVVVSFYNNNNEGVVAFVMYHLAASFIRNSTSDRYISVQELTNCILCIFLYLCLNAILTVRPIQHSPDIPTFVV